MYMCTYIYVYFLLYMYIYIYIYMYLFIYVYTFKYAYIYIFAYINTHICVVMHTWWSFQFFSCIHTYIYEWESNHIIMRYLRVDGKTAIDGKWPHVSCCMWFSVSSPIQKQTCKELVCWQALRNRCKAVSCWVIWVLMSQQVAVCCSVSCCSVLQCVLQCLAAVEWLVLSLTWAGAIKHWTVCNQWANQCTGVSVCRCSLQKPLRRHPGLPFPAPRFGMCVLVSVSASVCVYVCICVCLRVGMRVCASVRVHACVCMRACVRAFLCVLMSLCFWRTYV